MSASLLGPGDLVKSPSATGVVIVATGRWPVQLRAQQTARKLVATLRNWRPGVLFLKYGLDRRGDIQFQSGRLIDLRTPAPFVCKIEIAAHPAFVCTVHQRGFVCHYTSFKGLQE